MSAPNRRKSLENELPRVGFIGLGSMGVGMAANVIGAGYPLVVMGNKRREPVERLLKLGANEVKTPAEMVAKVDVVIVCVTTSTVVEETVYGDNGLLSGMEHPFMLIDCGTSEPDSTLKIGAELAARGCTMLDVPLGRSSAAAESGTLNMMAGGSKEDFATATPLLETMSENLFHVGELGVGHKLKLINNGYSMSVACLVAESVKTAQKAGVDLQLLYDVMAAGPNRSDFFDWMMDGPLKGDESKLQFSLANGYKDVGYFNAMAESNGADVTLPKEAQALLKKVVEAGHGDDTIPALIRHTKDT